MADNIKEFYNSSIKGSTNVVSNNATTQAVVKSIYVSCASADCLVGIKSGGTYIQKNIDVSVGTPLNIDSSGVVIKESSTLTLESFGAKYYPKTTAEQNDITKLIDTTSFNKTAGTSLYNYVDSSENIWLFYLLTGTNTLYYTVYSKTGTQIRVPTSIVTASASGFYTASSNQQFHAVETTNYIHIAYLNSSSYLQVTKIHKTTYAVSNVYGGDTSSLDGFTGLYVDSSDNVFFMSLLTSYYRVFAYNEADATYVDISGTTPPSSGTANRATLGYVGDGNVYVGYTNGTAINEIYILKGKTLISAIGKISITTVASANNYAPALTYLKSTDSYVVHGVYNTGISYYTLIGKSIINLAKYSTTNYRAPITNTNSGVLTNVYVIAYQSGENYYIHGGACPYYSPELSRSGNNGELRIQAQGYSNACALYAINTTSLNTMIASLLSPVVNNYNFTPVDSNTITAKYPAVSMYVSDTEAYMILSAGLTTENKVYKVPMYVNTYAKVDGVEVTV